MPRLLMSQILNTNGIVSGTLGISSSYWTLCLFAPSLHLRILTGLILWAASLRRRVWISFSLNGYQSFNWTPRQIQMFHICRNLMVKNTTAIVTTATTVGAQRISELVLLFFIAVFQNCEIDQRDF